MHNHKVTIITPIYNVEKYIERCAVSLFEQDFDDIEYIFVNDCTPDNSVEILEKIIEKYPNRKPNIKIIHHKENKGLGSARKTGLAQATGEYILHIDSDDWCELDMVSSLYNKAKETDADIVVCDFFKSYQDKDIYRKQAYSLCKETDLHRLLQSSLTNFTWNKLTKRSLYAKYNIYPPTEISFWEDKWVIIRLFCENITYTYLPKAFVHYWQENENSLSIKTSDKTFKDIKYFTQNTEQFLREKGLFEKYKDSLYIGTLNAILWQSNWEYDQKLISDICPEANKLKYIWKHPLLDDSAKKWYQSEYLNQAPFFSQVKVTYNLKKIAKKIKLVFEKFLNIGLFGLSYLIPRDKNIWIFGSLLGMFTDNVKHLFIYVNEHHYDIKPIWISKNKNTIQEIKNKGFTAYHKYSFKGIYYALRGRFYFFFSNVHNANFWASGGATRVNLWHGVPMKKLHYDIKTNPVYNGSFKSLFFFAKNYVKNHFMLSTSRRTSKYFNSAFRVGKFLEFGYPRNEILSYSQDKIMNFVEKYEPAETKELICTLKKYKKVFIYMPTWRDNGRNFIKKSGINFEELTKILKEKNECLLLKLHHLTKLPVNFAPNDNVRILDNRLDIYPILPFTDCLITDYSSIYFDYHLMEKEVVLFPFDKDEYIAKDREMYFDYDEVIENELVVNSFDELIEVIKTDEKSSGVKNKLLQEMILETKGIESCKEIVRAIKNVEQ